MRLLLIGAGVIGTVYGAQLGAHRHAVSVLEHGARTDAVARDGLRAHDTVSAADTQSPASVVTDAGGEVYDLILVAVRRDDLDAAGRHLARLSGHPLVLFFGNNPSGRGALPAALPGPLRMGFPGIGGVMSDGVARFVRIAQQPTALEAEPEPRLDDLHAALRSAGFPVQRVRDMPGWLLHHAVFVASIAAALYHCEIDPRRLAGDRRELRLMCQAITDGFAALTRDGVSGSPRNLAVLHSRALRPVAVRYWAHTMRSPMGELAFAAHCRRAEPEMRALAREVLALVARDGRPESLLRLLAP